VRDAFAGSQQPAEMTSQPPYQARVSKRWPYLIVLLAAGMIAVWLLLRPPAPTPPGVAPSPGRPAVPVEVVPVRAMDLAETLRGVGTLQAAAVVEIQPEISGRIRAIHFEEGMPVEEGQLLFELDDEKLRSQLAARAAGVRATQVRAENARRAFERQEQLLARELVPQDEFERAQAELDEAVADLERLEAELGLVEEQLQDTRISAPFAGTISERAVDRGAFVTTGDTLATLYQTDPLEIAFTVPERHLGRVARGQPVEVTVAAYRDRAFEGEVQFVSPALEAATRSLLVKAQIPNPDAQLKPGAFATAILTVGVREARPVVPEEALVATRRGYLVFTVADGVSQAREVETGLRRAGVVEILSGVEIGEQVVRAGHLRLSGGDAVEVVAAPPATLARDAEPGPPPEVLSPGGAER
jgi:membrane fusion protein, multidrug efflux system